MNPTTGTSRSAARWLLPTAGLAATLVLAVLSGWPSPAPLETAVADGGRGAALHQTAIPAAPAAPAERLAIRRPAPPVIAAAGDIACDPASRSFRGGKGAADACHMGATAKLLLELDPVVVLTLGDNQYENGTLDKFRRSYHLSWGRLKARTRPAPGNHDYRTADAAGYFDYFGAVAGHRSTGYYSFDVGAWHLIALNSECTHVGGCGKGSRQERWLRADLATHPTRCTLAYWHKPRFSSGMHGNDATYGAFWQALYAAGADVVLVGHDHDYERFAPQTPDARADPARGVREFVVGTGGKTHYGFHTIRPKQPGSQRRHLRRAAATLRPSGYDWRFLPEPGKTFTDQGHGICH